MMRKGTVMVVDDNRTSLKLITDILAVEGYQVRPADSGELALASIEAMPPGLILLDIFMPVMDGFEVLRRLKAQEETRDIPVIILSAITEVEQRVKGLNLGAVDFISKPYQAEELLARVRTQMELFSLRVQLEQQAANLKKTLKEVIAVISQTIEINSPYTPGHHQRVAKTALAIARKMGLTDHQLEGIELAAKVYDVGLLRIPSELRHEVGLLKGVKLTLYQNYPQAGYDLLKNIEFPWPIADIALQYRECYDGSGFPRGIKGEDIIREAKIFALADAIEDLTMDKSYRSALTLDQVLEEIEAQRGLKYDPDIVDTFLKLRYLPVRTGETNC